MVDVHLPPMANALLFRYTPTLLVCAISAILSWYNIPRCGTGTGVIPALAFVESRGGHEAGHPSAGRQNNGGLGGEALLGSAPQAIFFAF